MRKKSVQAFSFFSFLGLVLVVLYLWGKVQIDFAVRKNEKLKYQRQALQHDIDDLQVEINHLKSYPRITDLAKAQGLVFLPPDRIEDLPVDLSGLKSDRPDENNNIILADMWMFTFRFGKPNPSRIFGGAHGTH